MDYLKWNDRHSSTTVQLTAELSENNKAFLSLP